LPAPLLNAAAQWTAPLSDLCGVNERGVPVAQPASSSRASTRPAASMALARPFRVPDSSPHLALSAATTASLNAGPPAATAAWPSATSIAPEDDDDDDEEEEDEAAAASMARASSRSRMSRAITRQLASCWYNACASSWRVTSS